MNAELDDRVTTWFSWLLVEATRPSVVLALQIQQDRHRSSEELYCVAHSSPERLSSAHQPIHGLRLLGAGFQTSVFLPRLDNPMAAPWLARRVSAAHHSRQYL
jgi:hypothetical protein